MSLHNVSPADCERLDRAVEQARPDENGFHMPVTFDIDWKGFAFRVVVAVRRTGHTKEMARAMHDEGEKQ